MRLIPTTAMSFPLEQPRRVAGQRTLPSLLASVTRELTCIRSTQGAAKDRPISINVKAVFGPGDEVIQNALNYGLEATIPPRMIRSMTVDAPGGLGGSFKEGEIILLPTNRRLDEPVTLALNIMDGDRLLASCPIHLTEQTRGLRGSVVTGIDSTGWLQVCLKMDVAAEEVEVPATSHDSRGKTPLLSLL